LNSYPDITILQNQKCGQLSIGKSEKLDKKKVALKRKFSRLPSLSLCSVVAFASNTADLKHTSNIKVFSLS
jgi:hypothetical protein